MVATETSNAFDLDLDGLLLDDLRCHIWILGKTRHGKSNTILDIITKLHETKVQQIFPCAVIFLDPAGDAAEQLGEIIPDWTGLSILDPTYTSFALNPMALLKNYTSADERDNLVQERVESLVNILVDVLNTDPANAPRMVWLFRGALYFLYSFPAQNPTFRDLYFFLKDMMEKDQNETKELLKSRKIDDQIIQKTLEAQSELRSDAFLPVMNRIYNFVAPSNSLTARTFCTRDSTIDFDEFLEPGNLTVFRLSKFNLPVDDFRKLITSLTILNIFDAIKKRARDFEKRGARPEARTAVILVVDEFQNISDLKIIDTILSEAAKFGLFLYVAHQNMNQIKSKDTLACLEGNAGTIITFTLGPHDASEVSKIMSPFRADDLAREISGMRPYSSRVMVNRKGGPGARTYNIHFPKAPDPVHTYGQVITFLKTQMQEKYGGAHVHEDIIYKSAMQQLEEEKGKSAVFSPIKWRILTDLYLSDGFSKEHKRLSNYLYNLNKWESAKVDNTLEELFREGYLDADWKKYDYVLRGRDENNAQLGQPVRQSVQDDLERVRTTVYTLSKKGKELFLGYFARAAASKRSGGPVHLRAIRREVENTYWRIGNFCFIDWGEDFKEKPDIFVLSPRQIRISPDKNNKELQTWVQDAYSWDYDRAINVEVETYPLKNEDQVFRNFLKANGREVRFVVLDTKHIEDIHTILSVRHAIDRSKYTVDYAPFESLNNELVYQTIAAKPNEESVGPPDLARTVAETAAQASQEAPVNEQQRASDVEAVQEAKQETRQSSSAREKREERNDKKTAMKGIVELMSGEGFPGISKLAEKFSVSQKTISRYLKELEERGIVQKDVAGSYALSTEFKDHLAQTRKRRTENLAAPD